MYILTCNGVPVGVYSTEKIAEDAANKYSKNLPQHKFPWGYGFRILHFELNAPAHS